MERYSEMNMVTNPEGTISVECPSCLNPKYFFPDIKYGKEVLPLSRDGNGGISDSVSRMIKIIKKVLPKGKSSLLDGFENDDAIESEVIRLITEYEDGDPLDDIFHLIEAWGGSAGRGLYIHEDSWKDDTVMKAYEPLVKVCLETETINEGSMRRLVKACRSFSDEVDYIGISFITKHVHFWLMRNLGDDALPIFDSIMAVWVMRLSYPDWTHLPEYWKVMIDKAHKEELSLRALERRVFIYANEHK